MAPLGRRKDEPKKDYSKSFDKATSKLVKREAKADIYENADGTNAAVFYTDEVNWKDAKGDWHKIDPTLVEDGSGGFKNKSGPVRLRVPATTGAEPLAELSGDGWSVGYTLEGAKAGVKAKPNGAVAKYEGVLTEVDVEERALRKGVKETLTLRKVPAGGGDAVFRYPLTLSGLTPVKQDDGSIAFRDKDGKIVAVAPATVAWDADEAPAEGDGVVAPLGLVEENGRWVMEVRVPGTYLADPARTYPVTVDPGLDAGYTTHQYDAFASSVDPNGNYNGARQYNNGHYVDFVGFDNWDPRSEQYTYQFFDFSPLDGQYIGYAEWVDWVFLTKGYDAGWGWEGYHRLWPVADDWDQSSIRWTNLPNHRPEFVEGFVGEDTWASHDITDWVQNWTDGTWASKGIAIDTAGRPSGVRFAASEEPAGYAPHVMVTYDARPVAMQPSSPADGATVIEDRPTLTGAGGYDDDDPLRFQFRVSTQPDCQTGSMVNSGVLTTPSWTLPAGSLVDGTTYYWCMATMDYRYTVWSRIARFRYDLRLGDHPDLPKDSFSGVNANLATGNVHLQVGSPALSTTAGTAGIDYSYNSRAPQRYATTSQRFGLIGTYTNVNETTKRLVRRDRQLDFNWGSGSPGGTIPSDDFSVTWTGNVTVPASGTWTFGAAHDDDTTITVDGNPVLSTGCCSGGPRWGSDVSLTAGQAVPITVTMREYGGAAYLQLWAKGPAAEGGLIVPSDWLSTIPPTLPAGWSLSADGLDGLSFASAEIGDTTLSLVEPDGVVHAFTKQSDQSWKAVNAEDNDNVLTTVVESGRTTYTVQGDDGIAYTFDDSGKLTRAVSTADDRRPGAVTYDYDGATGRLTGLVDPVTNHGVRFTYASTGTTCPKNVPAGLTEDPPTGMLCQVSYWPGTDPGAADARAKTKLYYQSGRLTRIEEPGGEVTDFAYDSNNRLWKVRDSLVFDVVDAGLRADSDDTRTIIEYDGAGRVTTIKAPAPLAGDEVDSKRPKRTYVYGSGQTDVKIAGLADPNGYSRRVTFDSAGRLLQERDTAGLVTTVEYDQRNLVVSRTGPTAAASDPAAMKTTTVYDHAGRPVETYGPARASCFGIKWLTVHKAGFDSTDGGFARPWGFTGERPNGTCTNPAVPSAGTAYDESSPGTAMKGLAAAYWATPDQSGPAASHATGVGHATGAMSRDWGTTGVPDGLTSGDNWSARFTGEAVLAHPDTTYTFKLCADDGVRLFVDDDKLIDDWRDTGYACRTASSTVGSWYGSTPPLPRRVRLRIDYYERTGSARLDLFWVRTTNGATSEELVPGANLAPRYGLATTTTDADGKRSFTEYARPEYGLATASRVDPSGLDLTTRTEYEAPGEGYLRRKWKTMPKGPGGAADPTKTSYAYWGATESAPSNECSGTASKEMLKSTTSPDPAGSQGPIVREIVYDAWNRVVGRRVAGDSRWSCTNHDLRGRVTTSTDGSGKTTANTYSTPGEVTTTYADSSGASRTTVKKLDLLGREWSYTDEHGTTTRRVFDQAGRVQEVWRRFSGASDTKVQEFAYSAENRLASTTEHVSGAPRTTTHTYDAAT
ncbi:MAG TPA: PA14 domain-containing protein, partial [Acidimicrobiales bacterium]|nr:PA14 domain-containing protein [Acidimicrobiales bacterium]